MSMKQRYESQKSGPPAACKKAEKAVQNAFILSLQESMREEKMQ